MTRYYPGRFDLPRGNVMWVWPPPYGPVDSRPTQKTQLRIGDAERDRAIAALGDHFAAGRLTSEEFDQRLDKALQARFNDDLEPLFADLPQTVEPSVEQKSDHRSDMRLAWSAMLWLAPMFVMCAVVAAVLLSAPWLIWMLLWIFLVSGLFRHRRRSTFGPRSYHW
jgi:Sec-independent protein secretion pathway component TatC